MTDPTPSTPVTIRDQLHILSENLRGSSNHTLSTIWTKLDTLETSIDELKAQVVLLQEGLGANPYQSLTLTTTRGLLYAILGRLTTLALGTAPEVGTPENVSSGETIIDGRRYALFPNAISGVSIDITRTQLTRSDWTGWQYFIQTPDPTPGANGLPTVPGIWAPFGPFTTWDFSVEAQYSITVYLRSPTFYQFNSESIYSAQRIVFPVDPPLFVRHPSVFPEITVSNQFTGWVIEVMSGGPVTLIYGNNPSSGGNPSMTLTANNPVLFTATESWIWTYAENAFALRFTAP